jgi:hypothetical protein
MLKFNKNPFETQNRYGGYAAHGYGSDPLSKGNLARTSMPVGADTGYSRSPFSLPRAGGLMGVLPQTITKSTPQEEFESRLAPRWSDPWMGSAESQRRSAFEMQKEEEDFLRLKRQAEAQDIRSKMQFQPMMDQIRAAELKEAGKRLGISIPQYSTGPSISGAPSYMRNAMQSAMERSGGTSTVPKFTPASWMQSMNAPKFPRY